MKFTQVSICRGSLIGKNRPVNAPGKELIDGSDTCHEVSAESASRPGESRSERRREKPKIVVRIHAPAPISKIKPFQVRWREPLGKKECPYAYRWVLNLKFFSVRVHQWLRSDDKRHFHDHPWSFATIVLRGSYTDVSPAGRDILRPGSFRFRRADYRHYVDVTASGALTLLVTTAPLRNWGFWVKGKFKRPLRYFGRYGHPPCHEQ